MIAFINHKTSNYYERELMKKFSLSKMATIITAPVLMTGLMASNASAADISLSGNISVISKYVLRGVQKSAESNVPALQGGFDASHSSGLYLGYWASNLSYSDGDDNGYENDLYGGYSGSVAGVNFGVGFIQYIYIDIEDANGTEAVVNLGYGPVTVQAQYLTNDVTWGNAGDIYWTANAGVDLPKDFSLGVSLGYYTYSDKDSDNKFIADGSTTITSGFRHLNVSISHPIGNTGADMSLTAIYGGTTRDDTEQGSTGVLGISYAFDI